MTTAEIEATFETLRRTPAALRALLEGLPEELVRAVPEEGAWSAFDVVGHLIHGERTDWIPRLRIILTHGEARTFEPFDRFAQFAESAGKELDELLAELAALRAGNLEALRDILEGGLDPDTTGMHPELGRVTAGELLATWATHDLGHIAQIARAMARWHGGGAGPWRAYLPVLGTRA